MDNICRGKHISSMNWAWRKSLPSIHVYFLKLWNMEYKYNYENIYNNIISPLLSFLTCEPTPYIKQNDMDVISKICDCYSSSSRVYLPIYGATKAPHRLPHYVLDMIVLLEITFKTYVGGFGVVMTRKNKMTWTKVLLQVGSYKIEKSNK